MNKPVIFTVRTRKPCSICLADFVPTDESAESRHTCEECQQAFQAH